MNLLKELLKLKGAGKALKTVTGIYTLTSDSLPVSLPIPTGALCVLFMPDAETEEKILSSGTYCTASFAAVNIYQERIFRYNTVINVVRSNFEGHSGLCSDFSEGLSLSAPSVPYAPFISGSYIYTAYYGGDAV